MDLRLVIRTGSYWSIVQESPLLPICLPEQVKHLLAADEAIAVEVVDEEGEGGALFDGAAQEGREAADPLLQTYHSHVTTVEGAEDTVHEHLLSDHVERVVK